jgi:tRNA threonylcarbamoyl adenosine modification protein YeaZ
MKSNTVLALESAVAGGSVALITGKTVIGKWHSRETVSRSEELLARIAELLERSGVERSELSRIAVSNGPGSYTGIRIGLATAMGLASALEIPCVGISLLKAIGNTADMQNEKIVVLPIGRDGYCWQDFDGSSPGAAGSGKMDELLKAVAEHPAAVILAHSDAFQDLAARSLAVDSVVDLGRDLAVAVGLYSDLADDGLQPFYARDIPIRPAHGASN